MKGVGSVNSSKIKDARNCQKHVQTSVCVTGATFRKIAAYAAYDMFSLY